MVLKSDYERLYFPSGKTASEIYQGAKTEAKQKGIHLNEALDHAAKSNGLPMVWSSALVAIEEKASMEAYIHENGVPELVHSLGVQLSKRYFLRENGCLVETTDPLCLEDTEEFHLTPLVIVSLTIEGTSVCGAQIVPYADEIDIGPALTALWSDCSALLGVPSILKISKLQTSIADKLRSFFPSGEPDIRIVDGKDKRHAANIRSAQNTFFCFVREGAHSLEELNHSLIDPLIYTRKKDTRIAYNTLQMRNTAKLIASISPLMVDQGDILHPKHSGLRYSSLLQDGFSYTGLPYYVATGNEIEGFQSSIISDDWLGCVISSLPFTPAKLAAIIGSTTSDLELYLRRKAPLSKAAFWNLSELLNLKFVQDWEEEPPYPAEFGPLMLTPKSKNQFINAYSAVSRGGDLEIAYEMISAHRKSSYRYIIVEAYFDFYIFRLERKWPACAAIDTESLINFSGEICVKDTIFHEIERLCDEVIAFPERYHDALNRYFKPWFDITDIGCHVVDHWVCAALE